MITDDVLAELLYDIQKPGRYTNGEWNSLTKDLQNIKARIALVFPDVYEIGMSYLGQKILYSLLNSHPSLSAERVYVPWVDFEQRLRDEKVPLFSLETRSPLSEFDILGFSLLYDLNYSNVLTVLDLAKIPLHASQRNESHPLVIAGGPSAFNPEPLTDFFDIFLIGDGEEAFFEMIDKFITLKEKKERRQTILREMTEIKSVYVPSLYETYLPESSSLLAVRSQENAPTRISKRVFSPFQKSHFPKDIVVPNIQTVFDRTSVEIARGCPEKCRFCQAMSIYFPPRIKDPEFLRKTLSESIRSTGYESASLASLSVGDYPYLDKVTMSLMDELEQQHISLSLSSLRPKCLTQNVVRSIAKVRKTGFTLVPEAGTDRLRKVINKNMKDEEVMKAAAFAFGNGWQLIKLYFMIGLPTEQYEDLDGIVGMVEDIMTLGRKILKHAPRINISISSFIPKPHTPFQWERMEAEKVLNEKHTYIKARLKSFRSVQFKKHSIKSSVLEAVLSRGDRRLNRVIYKAWTQGARFDSWDDMFCFPIWENAFIDEGIDYSMYLAPLDPESELPWDHIDIGIKKSYLLQEMQKAYREESTPSCRKVKCKECQGCMWQPMYRKRYPRLIGLTAEQKKWFGRKTKNLNRYRVTYEKTGFARFLSHQDVMRVIQRSFRRADISVVYSQGYHPKMKMSFLPALALGMEGLDEKLEFKSQYSFSEKTFLPRVNAFCPRGIRFKALERRRDGMPSLMQELKGFMYSVDMNAGSPPRSPGQFPKNKQKNKDDDEIIRARMDKVRNALSEKGVERISFNRKKGKLQFLILQTAKKQTRPQDVVQELFLTTNPVYSLCRKNVLFHGKIPDDVSSGKMT